MPSVSFALALYLGVFLQTLLVGVFIPLLIAASYAQWKKVSMGRELNRVMVFTTVFSGGSVLTIWIIVVRRIVSMILRLPPGTIKNEQFLLPLDMEEIVLSGINICQIAIADMIMVYRIYHIYDKSLLACAVPLTTTAGLFAIGCGVMNQLRNLRSPANYKALDDWTAAYYAIILFNSVFMSAAISYRLWKVHREAVVVGIATNDSIILRAMKILVESAALWTLFVVLNFITFLANTNIKWSLLSTTSPVIGISFCLIIVRLGIATPEVREDGWGSSRPSHASRAFPTFGSQPSNLPVTLDHVKVEHCTSFGNSEYDIMELRVKNPTSPIGKQATVQAQGVE